MLDNINSSTVCHFHEAASKYNQQKLVLACERWLELNLIVHLRYEITFRNLHKDVLQKTLLSPRLFTFSEYHVLQTILCWIFLQVNTEIRLVPPYSAIITYFIRLSVPTSHMDIAMTGGNATLIQIQKIEYEGTATELSTSSRAATTSGSCISSRGTHSSQTSTKEIQ
ncbi:BTB/POZ domain-containing protein 16-like [Stegostoma tigrinum]|uniref:BTB/POZ domain-containing protein 16-like n=1 Tax=Stegostoma tigrinum TaxID=3053191 RepID=UPI00286FFC37|nr:BTB/POZ domain-containing protein 16-like [Stegostoma tigrinum]